MNFILWISVLFLLLALQTKIAICLAVTGIIGLILAGHADLLGVLSTIAYNNIDSFVLAAVPLFVLMAGVIEYSGMGARFYTGISPWFQRIPGGLSQSSLVVGIYTGFMTPKESAAVGACGTILIALAYRDLSWNVLKKSLLSTISVSCMILLLVVGAQFMAYALQIANIPRQVVNSLAVLPWPPMAIFAIICIFYVIMGLFFDGLSMVLITVPLVYPVIVRLGLDPCLYSCANETI